MGNKFKKTEHWSNVGRNNAATMAERGYKKSPCRGDDGGAGL
jgi:hypothetical protein